MFTQFTAASCKELFSVTMNDMDASIDIPHGKPIKTWDEVLLAMAKELAEDLRRTRALYDRAKDPEDTEE